MSRLGSFWIGMALISGVVNYGVKQIVQGTANELSTVQKKTIEEQKEIHELSADWTFLNQPELLADLNKRYVGLVPVSPKQVTTSIDALPLRPPPAPEPEPQIAMAMQPPASPIAEPAAPASTASAPAPTPAAAPASAAAPAPITIRRAAAPVLANNPAPIVEVAAAAPTRAAPSLDALFAQVAGDR
jgi:hypothetical protein